MIGISIATKWEWEAALEYFSKNKSECENYPFGEFFKMNLADKELIFYVTNTRKVNSAAANQYMICKYDLEKIIVIGTCAGIDDAYENLDIIIPKRAVQYDCTVKEIEPLIKQSFAVDIDLDNLDFEYNTGTIGTADKAVVMWKDYLELKGNGITIADTEAAGVAYVCKQNGIKCFIIKGISDFPQNEDYMDKQERNAEQINVYLENTPKVMKRILEDYLEKLI
ncbi:MAG: hypothetical protein IKB01_05585 [Lachnospiraceae bacterium]|nr:hypothetical protein [Lachnospiraceae bacterium]